MPNETHAVTVVLPCFNQAQYVANSLLSIFAQSFRDFELFIIDDGSTDNTSAVVEGVLVNSPSDIAVRFHRQPNRGLTVTLNSVLSDAGGRYFTMLSSDDLWEPTMLGTMTAELEGSGPRTGAAFADCWIIDAHGMRQSRFSGQASLHGGNIYRDLAFLRFIPNVASSVYRTDVLREVGGWNTERRVVENHDLWLRLARRHQVIYLPQALASYRVHESNMGRQRTEQHWDDIRANVDWLIATDPSLAVEERELRGRVEACYAGHLYTLLRVPAARRAAAHAIQLAPRERLAWTVLGRSLAGTRLVKFARERRLRSPP